MNTSCSKVQGDRTIPDFRSGLAYTPEHVFRNNPSAAIVACTLNPQSTGIMTVATTGNNESDEP